MLCQDPRVNESGKNLVGHVVFSHWSTVVLFEMQIGPGHVVFLGLSLRYSPATLEPQAFGKSRTVRPEISTECLTV